MKICFATLALFLAVYLAFNLSNAENTEQIPQKPALHQLLHTVQEWRSTVKESGATETELKLSLAIVLAGILCFVSASIASAGGIGGGGLYIPIMTIVAGLDLKTASRFSAFMVIGGSVANVMYNLFGKALLDFDLALLLEPCMLLGVSIGVLCNRIFPEWIITILFAVFLAWSTTKTCKNGVRCWKRESEMASKRPSERAEKGLPQKDEGCSEIEEAKSLKEPLLRTQETGRNLKLPWMKLGVLVIVWTSFFVIYLLRGNKDGKGIISIKPCGVEYWILLSLQIPLALVFTKLALSRGEFLQEQSPSNQKNQEDPSVDRSTKLMFPVMSFLTGLLGGVFGIGGGMLISPLLLQVGIAPEVTAATTSFMVFFSATMSAVQYLLLGMQNTKAAYMFSFICFIASLVGLVVVQKVIARFGRPSVIVFATIFGALDVWTAYAAGKDIGFKLPC
ncbi:PREDICTED: uncharacterized protein LOC104813355 [Tarenaya hassleriana]|uniref:uncharacterized protein LOC104813355 n=1 Tax=Tarenaya hassleriana TaxID=28532 RepID=UPI00053C3FEB|nr:PREDICTED: uncharacterized protein LOC104813355 [Tarenaya hassleriana]